MPRCPEIHSKTNAQCTLGEGHEGAHALNVFVRITDREREYLTGLRILGKPMAATLWQAKLMRRKGLTGTERTKFDALVEEFHRTEDP